MKKNKIRIETVAMETAEAVDAARKAHCSSMAEGYEIAAEADCRTQCDNQFRVDGWFGCCYTPSTTRVLWFSRHEMSKEQYDALVHKLGQIYVHQVDRTIQHASEVQEEIEWADVVAIVAPIGLQAEFLKLAGDRPVIAAVSERIITKDENGGESKVTFKFKEWEQLVKIEVVKETFAS